MDMYQLAHAPPSTPASITPMDAAGTPPRGPICAAWGPRLLGISVGSNLPLVVAYAVDPWTALGDPTRRAVFARLAREPRAVGEIASELPVSRPAVSQHLRVLKDAGLVSDRREGNRRIYAVRRDGLDALRLELDQFWNDALANFKALVDEKNQEDE